MKVKKIMINDRPVKELDDSTENDLKRLKLEKGKWRIGGMFYKPFWRVIIQIDSLEYDILLPGLYHSEKQAETQAKRITHSFVG